MISSLQRPNLFVSRPIDYPMIPKTFQPFQRPVTTGDVCADGLSCINSALLPLFPYSLLPSPFSLVPSALSSTPHPARCVSYLLPPTSSQAIAKSSQCQEESLLSISPAHFLVSLGCSWMSSKPLSIVLNKRDPSPIPTHTHPILYFFPSFKFKFFYKPELVSPYLILSLLLLHHVPREYISNTQSSSNSQARRGAAVHLFMARQLRISLTLSQPDPRQDNRKTVPGFLHSVAPHSAKVYLSLGSSCVLPFFSNISFRLYNPASPRPPSIPSTKFPQHAT
jgi:hypothetical protein